MVELLCRTYPEHIVLSLDSERYGSHAICVKELFFVIFWIERNGSLVMLKVRC